MITVARVKNWGHSLGIVIPKTEAELESLRQNDEVIVSIKKKITKVKDIFGKSTKVINTNIALKEIDRMFEE